MPKKKKKTTIKRTTKKKTKAKPKAKVTKQATKRNYVKSKKADLQRKAKKPGRRVSKNGNVYYEKRANRSDVDPKKRI